ncbi:MAG: PIN domain-containing protein [Ignavibacteriaceae bacterium]
MKVYLDSCCQQRSLDNRNQIRIAVEAEAVLGILKLIEINKIELISSEPLVFDISNIPDKIRRNYGLYILNKSVDFIKINSRIEKLAHQLMNNGIDPLDSLHLASAEISNSDYFCTTDDKLLKKAKTLKGMWVKAIDPL